MEQGQTEDPNIGYQLKTNQILSFVGPSPLFVLGAALITSQKIYFLEKITLSY